MDKIKEIRIREKDGSLSDILPIGADARNVEMANGNSVEDEINNKASKVELKTLETKVNNIVDMTPIPVSSVEEMTNTSAIYVNTTDGYWYTYENNEWIAVEKYQSRGIADGSVTVEKTDFIEALHLNHFKVFETDPSWHGIVFSGDINSGKIEIDGTCTENTNFNLSNGNDYFIEPGEYIFDLKNTGGTLSASIGVSMYGVKEDETSITLLNVGSETLPKVITLTEKVRITSVKLWITTGKSFTNYIIYPQLQKGTHISDIYPHVLYDFKNSYPSKMVANKIKELLPEEIENSLPSELQSIIDSKNKTEILVPTNIRYLPNRELSFYYDNLLYNTTEKEIYNHQSYNSFYHYDNCFRFNKSDVRTYWEKMIFNKNDLNRTQIAKNINLIGVDTNNGDGVTKKCLFIGDSLTNLGYYTQELLNLFDDDVMNIELLGTRGEGLNKHEGRASWSAYSYTHESTYTNLPNPFFNTTTNQFDFTKYMNDNNYSSVDIVSIALGTNDRGVVGSSADEIRDNLQIMIDSIKAFNANIKILLLLPPPICYVGMDNVNWNMSIKVANKTIIDNFDNRQAQNIYVVPTGLNVDPVNDYTMKTIPLNARSTEMKTVVNDPVHPDVIGFQHMADMIFPVLKYLGGL